MFLQGRRGVRRIHPGSIRLNCFLTGWQPQLNIQLSTCTFSNGSPLRSSKQRDDSYGHRDVASRSRLLPLNPVTPSWHHRGMRMLPKRRRHIRRSPLVRVLAAFLALALSVVGGPRFERHAHDVSASLHAHVHIEGADHDRADHHPDGDDNSVHWHAHSAPPLAVILPGVPDSRSFVRSPDSWLHHDQVPAPPRARNLPPYRPPIA